MSSLRVALVGAGWIGNEHLATLARLGAASVVAVCDRDGERARSAAGAAGAAAYESPEELLERERLDCVFVCTPPLTHRQVALPALARGLHVYLEKPIARTVEDAEAIVAAARTSGAICAIGYQWHALETLDELARVLAGQEVALLAGRSFGPTQTRPWFLERAQGGGNVLERASHHIDLQRAIAGEVERVQAAESAVLLAQRDGERGDIEDAAALVLHFERGALGTIVVAWTRAGLPGVYSLDILASEATLQLELDPAFRLHGVSGGGAVEHVAVRHPSERSIAGFLAAVAADDPHLVFCGPADALATLRVARACEEALATGETVAVRP